MGDPCEGLWSLPPQTKNPRYGPDFSLLHLHSLSHSGRETPIAPRKIHAEIMRNNDLLTDLGVIHACEWPLKNLTNIFI